MRNPSVALPVDTITRESFALAMPRHRVQGRRLMGLCCQIVYSIGGANLECAQPPQDPGVTVSGFEAVCPCCPSLMVCHWERNLQYSIVLILSRGVPKSCARGMLPSCCRSFSTVVRTCFAKLVHTTSEWLLVGQRRKKRVPMVQVVFGSHGVSAYSKSFMSVRVDISAAHAQRTEEHSRESCIFRFHLHQPPGAPRPRMKCPALGERAAGGGRRVGTKVIARVVWDSGTGMRRRFGVRECKY